MTLLPLLKQVGHIAHLHVAHRAMDFIQAGVVGPIRLPLQRAMRTIETGVPVPRAIENLYSHPDVVSADYLTKETPTRLSHLIAGLASQDASLTKKCPQHQIHVRVAHEHSFSRPMLPTDTRWLAEAQSRQEYAKLDGKTRKGIAASWRAFRQAYQETGGQATYDTVLSDFLSTAGLSQEIARRVYYYGQKYFAIHREITFGPYDQTSRISTADKIHRLQTFYGLSFEDSLASQLVAALEQLELFKPQTQTEVFKASHRLMPQASAIQRKLLAHFFAYRNESVDHFGFLLKTARLIRNALNGFSFQFRKAEKGTRICRDTLRTASLYYGIPYQALLYSYLQTVHPDCDFTELHFFCRPFYFEHHHIPKLEAYKKRPTLGEMLCLARLGWDLSVVEFLGAVRSYFPSGKFDTITYNALEINQRSVIWRHLNAICAVLGLDAKQALRTFIDTHYHQLNYPRLRNQPIYIDPHYNNERGKLTRYSENPSSLEEELFFQRKSLSITLAELGRKTGILRQRLSRFEEGKIRPTEQELEALANALNVNLDLLRAKMNNTQMSLSPSLSN